MNQTVLPDNVRVKTQDLETGRIIVRERQRKVDATHVRILRNSIAETGKQLVPVAVSERADGSFVLIDGAHRLEAAIQDGRNTVRSEIYTNLTEDLESYLELITNQQRKNLSPAEIHAAWETFGKPLFRELSKQAQLSGLRRGSENPVTRESGNGEVERPLSQREVAKEQTGYDADALEKMTQIRNLAQSETAPPEVRQVAQTGYERLHRVGAKIEPIYKEVLKTSAAVASRNEDPQKLLERDAEDRLDEIVRHTTLLKEKLDGNLREFLRVAGSKDQMGRDMLRATRVALVHALTSIVVIECEVRDDEAQSLQLIGQEVTTLLSQEAMKALGLRQSGVEGSRV